MAPERGSTGLKAVGRAAGFSAPCGKSRARRHKPTPHQHLSFIPSVSPQKHRDPPSCSLVIKPIRDQPHALPHPITAATTGQEPKYLGRFLSY